MANGLPDKPVEGLEFTESLDDETCPSCGWDREQALADPQSAFNAGILLAQEVEGSPFTAMSGTSLVANYFKCPKCKTHFTTEEELTGVGAAT